MIPVTTRTKTPDLYEKRSRAIASVLAGMVVWVLLKLGISISPTERDALIAVLIAVGPGVYGVLHPLIQHGLVWLRQQIPSVTPTPAAPVVPVPAPAPPVDDPAVTETQRLSRLDLAAAAIVARMEAAAQAMEARAAAAAVVSNVARPTGQWAPHPSERAPAAPPVGVGADAEKVASGLRRAGRRKTDPAAATAPVVPAPAPAPVPALAPAPARAARAKVKAAVEPPLPPAAAEVFVQADAPNLPDPLASNPADG